LLKQILSPQSITIIGRECFHKCSQLAQINIPDSTKELNGEMFLVMNIWKKLINLIQLQEKIKVAFINILNQL
jgi:hypothetical protein